MKNGEATFYDRLVSWWKNNRIIAITVFAVALAVGGMTLVTQTQDFFDRFNPKPARISEFNRLVQPIYFVERSTELSPGEPEHLAKIGEQIREIDPNTIIIKSYSSRFNPASNVPLTDTRGEYIARFLARQGIPADRMIVSPYGGRENAGLDQGYEERVEIELSE
jgi:outer membrane protein OmpA-like peptidoglycan-associated protein